MSKSYDIRRIYRGEIIGRYAEIVHSSDPTHVGLRGWIVDETKNTISIAVQPEMKEFLSTPIREDRVKMVPKEGTEVRISKKIGIRPEIESPSLDMYEIDLGKMVFRPEDRNKRMRRMKL